MAVSLPLLALSNTLLGIARGCKRMDYAAFAQNGVQSVVRLALVAVLVAGGWLDVMPAVFAFVVSDLAASATLVVLLNREFGWAHVAARGARRDVRAVAGFAVPLWISGLLRQFRNNISNLLVGSLGSVAGVGVLSVANRVNDVGTIGPKAVYVASRPLMAQLHDRGDHEALRRIYTATTRWTMISNIPLFLVMALFPTSLLLVFGPDFAEGATALVLLAFAQMISAATGTCQGMLDMTGHTRWKLINTIGLTTLLIGGGAYAIPRWGVVGAAASSLVAVASVNIASVLEVWFLERLHPYDRTFVKPVAAGVAAATLGLALRVWVPVSGVAGGLVQGTVVAGAFVATLLLLGLEDDDREIADRVLRRLHLRRRAVGGAT
jgi:O-antigen/teichoic acid export membrane protein